MTANPFDLTGRVAMVSGAASGMGQAMSLAVAEAGADVVLVDINPEGAQITAQQITQLGRKAVGVDCDVSDSEQITSLFEELDQQFGRIDFLGNPKNFSFVLFGDYHYSVAIADYDVTWVDSHFPE